jgi:8-oxo-dGTP diphosphatase
MTSGGSFFQGGIRIRWVDPDGMLFNGLFTMIDVVCGVIENAAGGFLACLRPQGKHLGGLWEFPGGKVEGAESPEAALVRELMEELGVLVEVDRPLAPVVWKYDRATIRLLPFHCVIVGGQLAAHEHEELLWCAPEEFSKLHWAAADLPILAEIVAEVAKRKTDAQPCSDFLS